MPTCLAAVLLSWLGVACSSYDPKLISQPPDAGHTDTRDAAPDGSSLGPDCVPLPEGSACEQSCPESCNGSDDDCDGRTDEIDRRSTCRPPHAAAVCAGDVCLIAACEQGYVDCNAEVPDGCESTLNSAEHCGVCGNACTFANGSGRCGEGGCELEACASDYGDCDGRPENGCERPLDTLSDCGGCGTACRAPNARTGCVSGQCRFVGCEAGFGDCNSDAEQLSDGDGCETKLDTPERCGECARSCGGATPYCSGGQCTSVVCDPARADCDEDNVECETDLRSLTDCGACGVPCGPLANATVTCTTGQCAASCRSGYRDCDSSLANGCETSVWTTTDCGQCGEPCSFPNAMASCASGSCELSSCNAGYGDCNADAALDGCEQRLNTNQHCGQCGRDCALEHAAVSCSSGTCQIASCDPGFGNCDGRGETGCEIDLATNAQHCGSCNFECPTDRSCIGGLCVCTSDANCASGQTCCDGSCVDLRNDEANCGSCAASCGSGQMCCSGSCKNLSSDFDNCGSCGLRCDDGKSNQCSSGQCRCSGGASCPVFFTCCSDGCEFGLGC